MKKIVAAITGPTASGKSEVAVELAKRKNAEIVSSDAVQVYQYLNIGSAKITLQETRGVRHHMIDIVKPDTDMNPAVFSEMAVKCVEDILSRGKLAIITGGSGLYHDSILYSSYDYRVGEKNQQIRSELEQILRDKGSMHLYETLREIDPDYAETVHPNNVKRVMRAIEFYRVSSVKKSAVAKERTFRFDNTLYFGLYCDREVIYSRINTRVDEMVRNGLIDEVRSLIDKGYDRNLNSLQAIGYKEIICALNGEISINYAIEKIKQLSRNYAKRQMTWFKKNKDIIWIDADKNTRETIVDIMEGHINEAG